jgi:hypothetical protein
MMPFFAFFLGENACCSGVPWLLLSIKAIVLEILLIVSNPSLRKIKDRWMYEF